MTREELENEQNAIKSDFKSAFSPNLSSEQDP